MRCNLREALCGTLLIVAIVLIANLVLSSNAPVWALPALFIFMPAVLTLRACKCGGVGRGILEKAQRG